MLEKIRKGSNNFFVKIILVLIAFSFVGIGGASFLGGNSRGNVVTFKDAPPITVEEFISNKNREIYNFQKQNNINLDENSVKELGFDKVVLQNLITKRMKAYLADKYDFRISEEEIINIVHKLPYLQNEDGKFDVKLFNAAFGHRKQKEEEFLTGV
jgi:peptidyl-prolyl cis-trans isomerase D